MPLLCRSCGSQVVYLRTQRTAWFDSGYMRCVSLRSISFSTCIGVDYGSSGRFSTFSFSAFAWFNSEYKFMRQSTWLVFLVTLHLVLYSFVVLRPLMLDIMAGMDQKDNFLRGLVAFPQVQLLDEVVVPVVCTTNAFWQLLIKVELLLVQLIIKVIYIPVAAQRQVSMVLLFSRPSRFHGCSSSTRSMPVVEPHRCLGWSRHCSFCGVPQLTLFWTG